MPGSATLARNARHNTPLRCSWMRPVVRSDETQKKGFGNSSMRMSPKFSCSSVLDLLAAHQRDQRQGVIDERIGSTNAVAHALGQFLEAPFRGKAGGDDRAHGGAAEIVERHARFRQRLDDADMGEAARAAARQHDADRTAGDEARQPADVVGVAGAQMMMGFEQAAAQREMLRQVLQAAGRDAAAAVPAGRWRAP